MAGLELAATVAALRKQFVDAAAAAENEQILFPVGEITVEFQVTVTREATGDAKARFWVVEAGTSGSLSREQVHTITVTLAPPVTSTGGTVKIHRHSTARTR